MRAPLYRLRTCRRGVAGLEFVLIAPVLLTILGGLADFGLALNDQMQLNQAVANGAVYAFTNQQSLASLGKVTASQAVAVTAASVRLSNVTVTASDPAPFCVQTNTQASPPTSSLVAGSYDTACPSGNPAGTYMTITAQYTYQPIMPFFSKLASTSLIASATVRLY